MATTFLSCGPFLRQHSHFSKFFFSSSKDAADASSTSSLPKSTTTSYTRRWYNPSSRRQLNEEGVQILRHWIEADQPSASEEKFSVVSYNILAERNTWKHRGLYPNVPSPYLKWNHRKRVICEELLMWNPDIICLQEVDKYFDVSEIMEKAGYVGSYTRRTGDAIDGCAIFWKADKFRLIDEESIKFKMFNLRDNVAQLSVLEMFKANSRRLLIGNIHVLYNPSRGDVKLGQIRYLLSRAEILSKKWSNLPFVLAGDFNSTPESAIYKFLSSSELNFMSYDRRELSGQSGCHPAKVLGVKKEVCTPFFCLGSQTKGLWTEEEVKVATGSADCKVVTNPFRLTSSYATIKGPTTTRGSTDEPLATSYHSKFLGTVDYIWYSDDLIPIRVVDTVPIDILLKTGGLPCEKVGSDHLPLVSEIAFIRTSEESNSQ
ncbi:carbon catabolite repressor protein 4-like protein 3 isoform X1 [Cucumis melo var. makuwa]|uniref:Carbon catabolite repressor protein 4 homolog 3 isoform X1 n=2 Tax=Cucumis melo TaxID=3656 RepID=A0A1S4DZP0_CUCME|nr:carbon catabolite repressor protein 4 homolog 3 [Cucumis melo]KAA0058059.1 carbon catabolite repressor protein 4-like protein 3 isoform X1 [Cucumis melo var. makuwa]TYK28405.1 carbon catabolite repressor protein 4-like protein 3 isoform X1 [Cucumis melo var. makuwa]